MRRTVSVVDVVDGCTFRVGSGRTVVLSGVRLTETSGLNAKRMRQHLEEQLLHRHVQLEEVMVDLKGQVIAQVWADGEDMNKAVISFQHKLFSPPGPEVEPRPLSEVQIAIESGLSDGPRLAPTKSLESTGDAHK